MLLSVESGTNMIINSELERMGMAMARFKALFQHLLDGMKKTTKKPHSG